MNAAPRVEAIVRDFMAAGAAAWSTGDATGLGHFFSDDAEYRNGPQEAINGRAAIVAELTRQMGLGGEVEADIRNLVADGPVVFTERIDYLRIGDMTASLRIAGVFEVYDGLIAAWRDYFDSTEFTAQLSAG